MLSQASLNAAFTSGQLVSGARHGYGWSVSDGPAHFVDHSGGWAGTSTYIGRDLDRGWSVVLLSNDEDFDTDIADAIAALYEK